MGVRGGSHKATGRSDGPSFVQSRPAVPIRDEECYLGRMTEAAKSYSDRIREKLAAAFAPDQLDVIDESEQHHGHGGWREGGETHFRVRIVATAFAGRSRVEQHRMINAVLAAELAERVHALALEVAAPR